MTSKIFKSSYMSDSSRLEIETSIASTSFHITHCTVVSEKSFMFDNTDAPALALAILEAAGIDDVDSGNTSCAVADLRTYVARMERITAEAKEQAELEAEALELYRTFYCSDASWMDVFKKETWLAVARKARELGGRAEK